MFFVYIIECKDNSLYTGWTTNIEKRLETHNLGKGSKYTRSRYPVVLRYLEECTTKNQAMQREYEIKQLTREAKFSLIETNRLQFYQS